jgi:hypothetical protein
VFRFLSLLLVISAPALAVDPAMVHARSAMLPGLSEVRATTPPPLTAKERSAVSMGELVAGVVGENSGPGLIYGVQVVETPLEALWSAISDFTSKAKWTRLDWSEVLHGNPCGGTRRVFQYLPVPVFSDRWWISDVHDNDAVSHASNGDVREMWWASIDADPSTPTSRTWSKRGSRVGLSEGGWLLARIDDQHTLVEYSLRTDPGGGAPRGLTNRFAAGSVRGHISDMVKLARAGKSACGR